MKKRIAATISLLFLLSGCAASGAKKASAKTASTLATSTTVDMSSTTASSEIQASTTSSETQAATTSSETQASTTSSETQAATASSETQASTVSSETQSTTVSTQTSISSQPDEKTLWNANKASELAAFMSTWGQEMSQQYRSYNNYANANLYGLQLPQSILDGEWTMVIGQTPVSVEWSESGIGQADFQLTAIYSDAANPSPAGIHVYFFGFQQNQPKVLITQQNQGNPNNYLYFKETDNSELKNGFNQIVNE